MLRVPLIAVVAVWLITAAFGQSAPCPAAAVRANTPADAAYAAGKYADAETLYGQQLAEHPHDPLVAAALVRTLLHEGDIAQATSVVNRILPEDPHSAALLTALAEVQLRQGQPWLALDTLGSATDPCYARTHLIRSRILHIDSMYASERKEIQSAYAIEPTDPDILHSWRTVVKPAEEIESIEASLASMKDLDPDTRRKAEASAKSMLPLLVEDSQTCRGLPAAPSAILTLLPSVEDGKHIDGYKLDVQFPQTRARLQVDTAASGLYIGRALAEANGLQPGAGDPPGTVRAPSVRIGSLEFRDCMVGVSDAPFDGKADGFIGTDIFSSYLITLDHPQTKLRLDPLPPQPGPLPGDRIEAGELREYVPVYHRLQDLLVPVTLNNKDHRLFLLDSGIRFSTMTSEVAHANSNIKMNFTNPMRTVSGSTILVYRDNYDFAFANLELRRRGHILEFDPAAIEQNAGLQIGGMLGFDMLHSMVLHLDYRDGLVKLESVDAEVESMRGPAPSGGGNGSAAKPAVVVCAKDEEGDRPLSAAIPAKVTGLLDSAHLKPGQPIAVKVMQEWVNADCRLPEGAVLYGHVTAAASSKAAGASELGMAFDHADCFGHARKEMPLKLIGIVAAPDEFQALHNVMPDEVRGVRNISSVAASLGNAEDRNLNPGGAPHTVHPGIVAGLPKIKLQPEGGPACSALLSSSEHTVRLGTGTEFLVVAMGSAP
jgi:tetratricopeptide (TPR) repeat protein